MKKTPVFVFAENDEDAIRLRNTKGTEFHAVGGNLFLVFEPGDDINAADTAIREKYELKGKLCWMHPGFAWSGDKDFSVAY
jgi:hypothetical protein